MSLYSRSSDDIGATQCTIIVLTILGLRTARTVGRQNCARCKLAAMRYRAEGKKRKQKQKARYVGSTWRPRHACAKQKGQRCMVDSATDNSPGEELWTCEGSERRRRRKIVSGAPDSKSSPTAHGIPYGKRVSAAARLMQIRRERDGVWSMGIEPCLVTAGVLHVARLEHIRRRAAADADADADADRRRY
jgi:hypothetical protein